MNVINFGPATAGQTIELDIIDCQIFQNTLKGSEGIRVGNFEGASPWPDLHDIPDERFAQILTGGTMARYRFAVSFVLAAIAAAGAGCSGSPIMPDARAPAQTRSSGSTVESPAGLFSVVEFRYPSSDTWYYAPQLRLSTSAHVGLVVTRIAFAIPGIATSSVCGAWALRPGQTLDAFREVYGDYEITFDQSGARATGRTATAVISVRFDSGSTSTITVEGPIVQGSLPNTYTGGSGSAWGHCF